MKIKEIHLIILFVGKSYIKVFHLALYSAPYIGLLTPSSHTNPFASKTLIVSGHDTQYTFLSKFIDFKYSAMALEGIVKFSWE